MNNAVTIKDFVAQKNSEKIVFTPGPGSLTEGNNREKTAQSPRWPRLARNSM